VIREEQQTGWFESMRGASAKVRLREAARATRRAARRGTQAISRARRPCAPPRHPLSVRISNALGRGVAGTNETYLLRAFLQYNRAFEIELFIDCLRKRKPDVLQSDFPLLLCNAGVTDPALSPAGSIWLRKRS
jgi:hypothetical protein